MFFRYCLTSFSTIGSPTARARPALLSVTVVVIIRFVASRRSLISITTTVSLTRVRDVRRVRTSTTHHLLYHLLIFKNVRIYYQHYIHVQ